MAIALSPPTLGKLLSSVRSMLNQPLASNSNWTDSQLTLWINQGVQRYFSEVVQNVEGHWTKAAPLNIVSGSETIALPSDFFEVKGIWKVTANGRVPLPYRNNLSDAVATVDGGSGSETYFPAYSFIENSIKLNPIPNYSETAGLYAVYKAKLQESLVNGVNMYGPAQESVAALYSQFENLIKNRSKFPQFIKPWSPE
jgi:hypothetical protein